MGTQEQASTYPQEGLPGICAQVVRVITSAAQPAQQPCVQRESRARAAFLLLSCMPLQLLLRIQM